MTYRYFGHSKSDRNLYRTKDEIETWRRRDPITRFRDELVAAEYLSELEAGALDRQAQKEIDAAVIFAEAAPNPEVATLTEYVYA